MSLTCEISEHVVFSNFMAEFEKYKRSTISKLIITVNAFVTSLLSLVYLILPSVVYTLHSNT